MNNADLRGVNIQELAQKCKSKKELYNFLSQDCEAFLPKPDSTNIYFLKQIIRAQKDVKQKLLKQFGIQYIRRENVKVSAVPQIDGLTVQDFLDYAKNKQNIVKYLPDERDWVHLDRQWICDLLYTVDTQGVQGMINRAQTQRKTRLEQNKDLIVEMRPEFVDALSRCLNFSTERGKAVNLIKDSSKRKRTLEELEEVKEEERALKMNKHDFLIQSKRNKLEREQLEEQLLALQQNNDQLMSALSSQNLGNNNFDFKMGGGI